MSGIAGLPAWDPESGMLNVVIETPKGSRNKYDFDPEVSAYRLKAVLPEGLSFPFDFGFIPSTLGEDGDPVDVLVLLDAPVMVGCLLSARLIGVIEADQRERDGAWTANHRLIAVATHARTHEHVHSLADVRPGLIDEIEAFFAQYNQLAGKEFKPKAQGGPERARALVDEGIAAVSRS